MCVLGMYTEKSNCGDDFGRFLGVEMMIDKRDSKARKNESKRALIL